MSEPILSVEGVGLEFGGIRAIQDVTMSVREGEVYALVGPNGAGKTSLLNCINGFYRPQRGTIRYRGQDIIGMRSYRIAALGVGRTFQNIELFRGISVLDNLLLGRHLHMRSGVISNALRLRRSTAEESRHRKRVEEIIEILELGRYRKDLVGNLAYGKQKLVEMGRALALEPDLLLLDEPAGGMNRDEREDVARFILRVRHEFDITQVLIEHDIRFVSDLSHRVTVLNLGAVLAEGTPQEVFRDKQVIAAFAGGLPDELAAANGGTAP
jgi:branched-chain amino acid transport system ATP-binding protein